MSVKENANKSGEKSAAKKPDLKKAGKRAAQIGGGAALAVSLFFGGLFASPKDIVDPDSPESAAIVQTVEAVPSQAASFGAPEADEQSEEKRSLGERIKAWLTSLPLAVRLLFVLPAWAVGFGLIQAFSLLGSLTGIPIVGALIKWFVGAAVLLGLILLAQRLLFPNVPIKELLKKRNLIPLGACAAAIALAGALGGLLWRGRPYLTAIIDISVIAAYTIFLFISLSAAKHRAKKAQ